MQKDGAYFGYRLSNLEILSLRLLLPYLLQTTVLIIIFIIYMVKWINRVMDRTSIRRIRYLPWRDLFFLRGVAFVLIRPTSSTFHVRLSWVVRLTFSFSPQFVFSFFCFLFASCSWGFFHRFGTLGLVSFAGYWSMSFTGTNYLFFVFWFSWALYVSLHLLLFGYSHLWS